jgi:gliding motility-associated-like protein
MRTKTTILLILAAIFTQMAQAQESTPSVSPTAIYTNDDGEEVEDSTEIQGQAPLDITFRANPKNMSDYSPSYEWHFQKEGEETELMVRYEEDTQYTFSDSGTTLVTLIVKLSPNGEELTSDPIKVTIYESKLVFPNAFSPNNGDEINNTFKPKEYQSIVEFHAYIFNRWGQKLYEWTDPAADGWDGTYNGKDVKDGTYFLLCKARGADGRKYDIRKDVNILRGYIEGTTQNNTP